MQGKKIHQKTMDEATATQAAILADILLGASYKQIRAKYGIGTSTAARWCLEFGIEKPPLPVGKYAPLAQESRVILDPKRDITTTIIQNPSNNNPKPMGAQFYEYLEASLAALSAQLRIAADPAYIKRQNAHDLATLHNVIGNRATELANAFTAGERLQSGDDED